ncbi:MAG TPA: TfoX/Sxy family protein [Baekduia sp.]|nr:TfoX/Sxy family protein [Baekduia sp.]
MAYDEDLAMRLRDLLAGEADIAQQRMFGGVAFLAGGNLAVAASGQGGLMVRVDPGQTDALLGEPGAGPFEMRGRPVDGWVRVAADAVAGDRELRTWVDRGLGYARSLPAKR